jgi:anti-sigma factor RsiW
MSHLDEGTLHALLDGELNLAEVSEIQMHLGSCVACGSRLQEVKQVLAEADRLVGAMDVPAGASRRPEPPPQASSPRPPREPAAWDETPVLLVPDPIDANARRARWLRGLRWAAMIAVVVGGGKLLSSALRPSHPMLPERDLTSASPSVPPPVVSPQESRRSEPPAVAARKATGNPSQGQTQLPKSAAKPAPVVEERAADTVRDLADAPSEDSVSPDSRLLAAQDAADTTSDQVEAESAEDSIARVDSVLASAALEDAAGQPGQDDELATRRAAAEALAELDRQRRRDRANAATAALPPARPEVPPAAEPAPPARTLQQRAQVDERIGLDEAARQLGHPLHVIEGMTPEFIGLTQGRLVPGADPSRPVVRVVYLDSRERMILLDQQRMRTGQAPGAAAGNLRWTIGDVMLYLRGEPSPEVLRGLQRRVR